MPFELHGKVAAVTGASSGIGQCVAELFARQGAHVHLLDVDAVAGENVAAAIRAEGHAATFRRCDVASAREVNATFDGLFADSGRLDILVNNAGISHIGTVETTTEEELDRIYSINVKGVFHCLKAGVEKMKLGPGGAIVNMASVASLAGLQDRFAYSMSKGAVLTMTLSVASDCLRYAIRCNCICPARIHTPFVDGFIARHYPGQEREIFEKLSKKQPIGRMGKPEEVAALALYLCSDEAAFVTGSAYPIDGGATSMI
jgi:NAD(P)-dependent dehydrogenase (short-subunit alcohol dehydrogenase family)